MKFWPGLLKVIAAALAPVAVIVIQHVLAYFQGAVPSDVSAGVWIIISGVAVFVLNFILGKLPTA